MTVVLSCVGVWIVLEVSELKDSHTGKIRARTIELAAESVAAEVSEVVSQGSIVLIGAELEELWEYNT